MRILYSHRVQSRDGQSVHIDELVSALREAGHEVLVVGPGLYSAAAFGGESRLIPLVRKLLPRIVSELGELAYNIPAYARLRVACRKFRPELIYERYNAFYLAGAWLARRQRLLFYLETNAPLAEERSRFGGLGLPFLASALELYVWRAADRVLVVTGVLGQMIAARGVDPQRIVVVPNGVAAERFPSRPVRTPLSELVLGFVGFVRAWHGLDAVIRAMAAHRGERRIVLTIVGDGPARPELARLAAQLGIAEHLRFLGVAAREDIPRLISEFDVALQPKAVAYASPLKIFEYMIAGCAIVAPDQPNIREVLEHERTALLFDPERDGALWSTVLRLAADAGLRERLGMAAREEIRRRDYSWSGNARRIVERAALDLRPDPANRRRDGSPGLARRPAPAEQDRA